MISVVKIATMFLYAILLKTVSFDDKKIATKLSQLPQHLNKPKYYS